MPIGLFPALLGLAILVAFASGIWLLLHARAVAARFRGQGTTQQPIEPGHGPARDLSRNVPRVVPALIAFNLAWISCVVLWYVVATGLGNKAVETDPATVQRP